MASRSSPHAFDPSPALVEKKENFSPLNPPSKHESRGGLVEPTDSSKGVRFSPVIPPARRAHSVATSTLPHLEPIPSASQLPRQSSRSQYSPLHAGNDVELEASRTLLERERAFFESQRQHFEIQRQLWEDERKLWTSERAMLNERIAELEVACSRSRPPKRRYSNESAIINPKNTKLDLGLSSRVNSVVGSRASSQSSTGPPIWEMSGGSGTVTRVFSTEEQSKKASSRMPSIAEDASSPGLESILSSVRIEEIDSKLDGINLRTSNPNPSISRILSHSQSASPQHSPSPRSRSANDHGLQIQVNDLLPTEDAKLKLYAGHTPMAFAFSGGEGSVADSDTEAVEASTPKQENPLAPQPSQRPSVALSGRPSERANSYFPTRDQIEEEGEDRDPELKGQLIMDKEHQEGKGNPFLDQLDAKLLMEAKKILGSKADTTVNEEDAEEKKADAVSLEGDGDDGGVPKLKIKQSMNFGSAFGSSRPGNI